METVYVEKVVDGDTLILEDGQKVRLLGINAPEKGELFYEEAKARLKELVEGKSVYLEYDKKKRDRYGRRLAHLFAGGKHINALLVEEGLATAFFIAPNFKYKEKILNAEKRAFERRRGIWASAHKCAPCLSLSVLMDPPGNDCEGGEEANISNGCAFECDLRGWTLRDSSSKNRFPLNFTLSPNATYRIIVGCGEGANFWCKKGCAAVWDNEWDAAYLVDEKGFHVLRVNYLNVRWDSIIWKR